MNIYIVSFPRSGLHWLSWMLGEALDAPVQFLQQVEHPERTGDYWIYGCHALPEYHNGKVVYLQRDPRDIAVSWKHFWNYTTVTDAIKAMGKKWNKHADRWRQVSHVHTSYEKLHENTISELYLITRALGLVVPQVVLEHAVEAHTVEKDAEYAQSFGGSHGKLVRKGAVGQWKEVFSDEDCKLAKRLWKLQ